MGKSIQQLLPIEWEARPVPLPAEVTRELLHEIAALLAQLARLAEAKEASNDPRP